MSREQRIRSTIEESLQPVALGVENESHQHSGPATESHFKVLVVADIFAGKSRIERQRLINDLLKDEFTSGLHALTQRLLTPEEYAKGAGEGFVSPACMGGPRQGAPKA